MIEFLVPIKDVCSFRGYNMIKNSTGDSNNLVNLIQNLLKMPLNPKGSTACLIM